MTAVRQPAFHCRAAQRLLCRLPAALAVGAALVPEAARADVPMGYLRGFGLKAQYVSTLTWALLILSIAVVVIVSALVLIGVLLRRARTTAPFQRQPIEESGNGI